jgi:hypothetical protein
MLFVLCQLIANFTYFLSRFPLPVKILFVYLPQKYTLLYFKNNEKAILQPTTKPNTTVRVHAARAGRDGAHARGGVGTRNLL